MILSVRNYIPVFVLSLKWLFTRVRLMLAPFLNVRKAWGLDDRKLLKSIRSLLKNSLSIYILCLTCKLCNSFFWSLNVKKSSSVNWLFYFSFFLRASMIARPSTASNLAGTWLCIVHYLILSFNVDIPNYNLQFYVSWIASMQSRACIEASVITISGSP